MTTKKTIAAINAEIQRQEQERAEFEAVASNYGEYPRAIERDAKGDYLLMTTAHGWMWWQAARRAPAEPVISEAQVLAITTAYEQGVGKGHQSHARTEAITNPYSDEWGCDSAWQMGYDEGREQAEQGLDAKESEYQRGYRHGYNRRDAEVKGALL